MSLYPQMNVRVDVATKKRWKQAADKEGMSLSQFVRSCVEARVTPPRDETKFLEFPRLGSFTATPVERWPR